VAPFVGARPEDIAFVNNATSGANAVLRSLDFRPGDALLTTNHAYNACKNTLDYVAERSGARVVVAEVPIFPASAGEIVDAIVGAATPDVRLALVDHVTSPSGLIFPIVEIVRRLRERGIDTLVDGAHGPGMVPVDVTAIGAAYYVANFHKWVCAPKGAAMLWVAADKQNGIHPTVISHGLKAGGPRSRFVCEFDWTGSDDPSPWLSIPEAIRFVGGLLPGGWSEIRKQNHELALEARRVLSEALGVSPVVPDDLIGSLATLPLPDAESFEALPPEQQPLHVALFERHRIEVPVFSWPGTKKRLIRVAAHLYNTLDDYRTLARALVEELGRSR
jgi:isopenicillin-N epimerase